MKEYGRDEAILRMNILGKEKRPFVFLIDYKQEISYIEEPQNIASSEWLYDLNGFTNIPVMQVDDRVVEWNIEPIPYTQYKDSFSNVMKHLRRGNTYLVNLTCMTPVSTNLSLSEIFFRTKAKYKVYLKDRFVVFSPEIFIQIKDGFIHSYPMKGTIDAALPDACTRILEDEKEAAEHATIVDLIRNDVSRYSRNVEVQRYRYVEELQTNDGVILQVSSEISGELDSGYRTHLGDILFSLLPAGSVTGAPKNKTLEIIGESENYERGFYTGVTGYFDGTDMDSAVLIRFLEQRGNGLFFKSGGGITAKSDCRSEYEEMIQKVYVPIY
ncbi:MAG: aminodeoxychorismate synthase component I [Bacteroidales bacterium]|nr:aminodeoxychorismate synthase component I [Bacteroidales bacterium]